MKVVSKESDKPDILTKVGIFALFLLVTVFSVYLYSPVIKSNATTSDATPTVNVNVGAVIGISVSADTVNMNANVNSFVHAPITVSVTTNSLYGYTLAIEDADSDTSMRPLNTSVTSSVASDFSGSKTSESMDDNTWGYSTDETNYYKIPEVGSPVAIKRVNSIVSGTEDTTVDFGAKVGNLTAGTYRDTIRFTAYTNGVDGEPEDGTEVTDPTPTIDPDDEGDEPTDGVMQSFNCSSIEPGTTVTLSDARDGKHYTVLKATDTDNTCWMTQNLRIAGPRTLTSELSDVSSDFNLPASGWETYYDNEYNTAKYFYNPLYVYDLYTEVTAEDVEEAKMHGGYYNYYTATAGTISGDNNTSEAQHSICPKGWKIPSIQDYWNLQSAYSLTLDRAGAANMAGTPLNFLQSGQMSYTGNNDNVYPQSVNGVGKYWTSTADGRYYRYVAGYNITKPFFNTSEFRYLGLTMRCVAR